MRFAKHSVICTLVLAVACAQGPGSADSSKPTVTPLIGKAQSTMPVDALIFGARAKPRDGQTQEQAMLALEDVLGRRMDADRVFKRWDQLFPAAYDRWTRDMGRTVFLSIRARRVNGDRIRWAAIADAKPGSALFKEMIAWATNIKKFGAPVYVIFHHEPEFEIGAANGSSGDFVRAWRRLHTLFKNQGVTNASWLWTLTAQSFDPTTGPAANLWYPGDAYVDYVGADGYNWYSCRTGRLGGNWVSFEQIFDPVRRWAAAHGKAFFAPEWGSQEDPGQAGRKADWLAETLLTLQKPEWNSLRGVLYFHSEDPEVSNPCEWWVDSSVASLRAFKMLAVATIASS